MARKTDSTPAGEPSRAAAILPGVPLPEWALSGEEFLPELDTPELTSPAVALPAINEPANSTGADLADVNLDGLSISEMEAALREFSAQITASPVGATSTPLAPIGTSVLDDPDEQDPQPVEFAVPGYPETPAVPQVPMPLEQPGYPTESYSGPVVMATGPSSTPTPVIPPPPPPPVNRSASARPSDTPAVTYSEPIRLDLPMSAVLAREFTRTIPMNTSRSVVTRTAVEPSPTFVVATETVTVPVSVPEVAAASLVATSVAAAAPASARVAPPVEIAPMTTTPALTPDSVELSEEPYAAAPRSGNRRLLTLIGLGVLLALLAAAAAFFMPGILNPTDTPAATPSASTAATNSAPSAPAPITPANFLVQTPDTIGDLTRMSGPIDLSLRAATTASAIPGLGKAVSAVYGNGTVPAATVIAWHAVTPPAASSVSQAFAGFQSSAKTTVTNVAGVSSTGLPGQMSCGETTINATPTTLCFWADPGTFGSITVVAPKTPADGALTAAEIRSAVEYQK